MHEEISNKELIHFSKNALLTIRRSAVSIAPILKKITEYCIENSAFHLATNRQFEILNNFPESLQKQCDILEDMLKLIRNLK